VVECSGLWPAIAHDTACHRAFILVVLSCMSCKQHLGPSFRSPLTLADVLIAASLQSIPGFVMMFTLPKLPNPPYAQYCEMLILSLVPILIATLLPSLPNP